MSRYGVVGPAPDGISVISFVEKPAAGTEPSHEVSIGRYLYTPEFFDLVEEGWGKHSGGEYFHAYALDRLIAAGKVAFERASGIRLDTGDPAGYLEAILTRRGSRSRVRAVLEKIRERESPRGPRLKSASPSARAARVDSPISPSSKYSTSSS